MVASATRRTNPERLTTAPRVRARGPRADVPARCRRVSGPRARARPRSGRLCFAGIDDLGRGRADAFEDLLLALHCFSPDPVTLDVLARLRALGHLAPPYFARAAPWTSRPSSPRQELGAVDALLALFEELEHRVEQHRLQEERQGDKKHQLDEEGRVEIDRDGLGRGTDAGRPGGRRRGRRRSMRLRREKERGKLAGASTIARAECPWPTRQAPISGAFAGFSRRRPSRETPPAS